MADNITTSTTVRAVERALDILLYFAKSPRELSLSEIAREVGLHKSTAHRLLLSLQTKGFVRKQPGSDKYILGWSVLELLGNVYLSDELTTLALPEMAKLRDVTGETVSLYIRSGIERIRVQAVESNEPIRNVVAIGKKYPLYIGASGKVLLAFADEAVVEEVFLREQIPLDFAREDLLRQLDKIRIDGYAVSIQERDNGAAAIAAPVFGRNRECIAALSISGPVSRFTVDKMNQFVDALCASAAWLAKRLSH
ncbi:IclR family transcriptional regulator [Alicyclobacillus fastidiosus]|uniref:IclR family transcriptional regulator n=1 Tax=Alicyclobacillus fastidiosus TaxID=392011 RepID=A0ABY6ZF90_9BACL|nr:IclR family transcriptional regulator [Alicyclobacillus fastidiosus]WAH41569.1 IclR family transcriptional regulator [Alicyclobacillus fastidiosus]GMA63228.1 IclR family transcriptional regulator [Alicyclobacillus fastidiosus]